MFDLDSSDVPDMDNLKKKVVGVPILANVKRL